MKGIVSILEVMLTGMILILAFLYFFPQYAIKTEWNNVLLQISVKDTLNTIDRLDKTYEFATDNAAFNQFMNGLYSSEKTGSPMVWWKDIDNLPEGTDTSVPYFSRAYKATIVDVVNTADGYQVYSFTLGLGFVY